MAAPFPRTLGLAPGAASLRAVIAEFRSGGPGVATALSDNVLPLLKSLCDEDAIEVLPFGMVARRFLSMCDERPPEIARGGHFVAALGQACEELEAESPFAASASFSGFHRAAARTLEELRGWGVGSQELVEAAAQAEAMLGEKLESLAFLEREANATLANLGRESGDAIILRSLECKPARGCSFGRLLVIGGSNCEPMKARWLRWAAESGCDVVVTVDWIGSPNLFESGAKMAQALGPMEPRGEVSELCRALFTGRRASSGPAVAVSSCADAFAEAEWALRGCLEDLESGIQPHEIAIYARDMEEYAPYLQAAAARMNVSLQMSHREPVLTNRFVRLLLNLLDFCSGDDARALLPVMPTTYLGLDRSEREKLEAGLREAYRARRNQWPVLQGWADTNQADFPWLPKLLDWRAEALREDRPLSVWVQMLRHLGDLPLARVSAPIPTAPRDARIMTALQRPLAHLASVRRVAGDRPISLRRFYETCRRLWSDEEYTVPATESGIVVRSSAEALPAVRSLRVVGMLEGVFPRRRSEDPVLSDGERAELSRLLGLVVPLPNSVDRARAERDEFCRVCAAASQSIAFSYPLADENRDNVPAFYLHEVERVKEEGFGKSDKPRVPIAPPREECLAEADKRLRDALDATAEDSLPVQFLVKEVADQFAWPPEQPFSPEDLREALRCEFQHFARRRLKLKPKYRGGRWASLRKLPRQARLMQQDSRESAAEALQLALEATLDEWYGDVPEWEVALLRSGARRLIREWVEREFEARAIWPRDPVVPDVPFGAPGLRDLMPGDIPLSGIVAGVSKIGPYSVAHLYESQSPKAEGKLGGVLDEVDALYYGLHLLARYTDGPTAIEVESMAGTRSLLILPRVAEAMLPSRRQAGLQVIDLAEGAEGGVAKKGFYDDVKRRLSKAAARLRQSGIEPTAGEHCQWCGFGELCRRAHGYGEDDSPFGTDDELETD